MEEGRSNFRLWCERELSNRLNLTVDGELLDYLMGIETERDLREYLVGLIGEETSQTALFVNEFLRHWQLFQATPLSSTPCLSNDGRAQEDKPILTATPPPSLETQVNGKRTQTSTDPPSLRSSTASGSQRREAAAVGQPSQAPRPHPRGRQAYVPLMSMEGQSRVSTHLPGRHPCQCLAQKHSLINNCVECGRIVCSQHPRSHLAKSSDSLSASRQNQRTFSLSDCHSDKRLTTDQLPVKPDYQKIIAQAFSKPMQLATKFLKKLRGCSSTSSTPLLTPLVVDGGKEGSGPCLFCGALVCTAEEEELLLKDSKKARKFREQFLRQHNLEGIGRPLDHIQTQGSGGSQQLLVARHHRDKLLEFDQTSSSQTRVIDDQSDYFTVDSNRWLSSEEKEALLSKDKALREEKYGSRRKRAVVASMDISGHQIREEDRALDLYSEKHANDAVGKKRKDQRSALADEVVMTHAGALYNTTIPAARPQFVESPRPDQPMPKSKSSASKRASKSVGATSNRLQDKGLQEMRDEGCCLSMHQPWASLLVAGVKRCEGRSWYSAHRGRLWIAATKEEPSDGEIAEVQEFYMALYGDQQEQLYFPSDYPTSCLLGCVDVLDCVAQEDYRENYPEGESESDYVFIVENPQELTVKFPIKGNPKIWKLAKDVHLAARMGLKTGQ